MCDMLKHRCYCGVDYDCTDSNWLCPTNNGDEESNMCPKCLDKWEQEYTEWFNSEEAKNV